MKKPLKTKALCAAATAVLFALVSAPSAYCAETDVPGTEFDVQTPRGPVIRLAPCAAVAIHEFPIPPQTA